MMMRRSKKKTIAIFGNKQWLLSIDMKTKVVQHVPRINLSYFKFQIFKFSNFQIFKFLKFSNFLWFPAFVWLSDIFFPLSPSQHYLCACQDTCLCLFTSLLTPAYQIWSLYVVTNSSQTEKLLCGPWLSRGNKRMYFYIYIFFLIWFFATKMLQNFSVRLSCS